MTIGERLLSKRKSKHLSRAALSKLSGVSESTIKQYENGSRKPQVELLAKLSSALGCYVSEFVESGQWSDVNCTNAFAPSGSSELMRARLDNAFNSLNDKGQSVAVERVEELTKIPDYQLAKEPPQPE